MDGLLTAFSQSDIATYLRFSRWAYAAVNTSHVLGIALLVGAVMPLDLRLLGAWRHIPHQDLARVLVPVAATGLLLAMLTGTLLFSVRANEYAAVPMLWLKATLILAGIASAIAAHARYGAWLDHATRPQLIRTAAISMACWMGALISGRLIAFSGP